MAFCVLFTACSSDTTQSRFNAAAKECFNTKAIQIENLGALDSKLSSDSLGFHEEGAPFYGFLKSDIVLEDSGVVIHYYGNKRSDDNLPYYWQCEDSVINMKSYDYCGEDVREFIQREIDFRYHWYQDMNNSTDPDVLKSIDYEYLFHIENGSAWMMPESEYESTYEGYEGQLSDTYIFNFKIPAAESLDSVPYFVYDWRPYGMDVANKTLRYNRELQIEEVNDGICSYIYGTACIYDDSVVTVFAYKDTNEARAKVDEFCNKMGMPSPSR